MKANTLIFLLAVLSATQVMALEKPQYKVLYADGNIEYRQYKPYLVAETVVTDKADRNDAANKGFMRLFKYITGANTVQAKIDMTAPVQQAKVSEDIAMTAPVQQARTTDGSADGSAEGWRIAFMLPSKYSLTDAPVPDDESITIHEVPGRVMAVIRYSGRWTSSNVDKNEAILMQHLTDHAIASVGTIETAAYNAPFTPPFMRRNELMLEIVLDGASYPVADSANEQRNSTQPE